MTRPPSPYLVPGFYDSALAQGRHRDIVGGRWDETGRLQLALLQGCRAEASIRGVRGRTAGACGLAWPSQQARLCQQARSSVGHAVHSPSEQQGWQASKALPPSQHPPP